MLALLRPSAGPGPEDNVPNSWQGRLLEMVQQTIAELVMTTMQDSDNTNNDGAHQEQRSKRSFDMSNVKMILLKLFGFNSNKNDNNGESNESTEERSGRSRRSLTLNDLQLILDEMFPGTIEGTKLWLDLYQGRDVVRRMALGVRGADMRGQLKQWLGGQVKTVTDALLSGQVGYC